MANGLLVNQKAGFTLIELLLSISIITIIAGFSLPVYNSFYVRTDLDSTTEQVAFGLRRAQSFSRASLGDNTWGVKLQTGSAVVYKGSSFAARDTAYDEIIPISNSITTSGIDEVRYSKLTGTPFQSGSITLTNNNINKARTVEVNDKGLVTY